MNIAPDGREAASMLRRKQRIVDAATVELASAPGAALSLDAVAERAGVSRRTVFNYFRSVEGLLVEVGTEMIGDAITSVRVEEPSRGGGRAALFDDLRVVMRAPGVVATMVQLTHTLGPVGEEDERVTGIVRTALARITDNLTADAWSRYPELDRLDVELLIASLLTGCLILYGRWSDTNGAVDTPESRQAWAALVDRHVDQLRNGFLTA